VSMGMAGRVGNSVLVFGAPPAIKQAMTGTP